MVEEKIIEGSEKEFKPKLLLDISSMLCTCEDINTIEPPHLINCRCYFGAGKYYIKSDIIGITITKPGKLKFVR